MLLKEVLTKTTTFFKDKGIASARLDTEILLAHALDCTRIDLYLKYEAPLTTEELDKSRELVRRRATGEPIAYITGHKDFWNASFIVTADTLIPRPETEGIVDRISREMKSRAEDFWIVDLGTGTGCIGLSLLQELPLAKLVAVDLSEKALAVARQNAEQMDLSERCEFIVADAGTLDEAEVMEVTGGARALAVVANPPYIDQNDPSVEAMVRKFEPASALFAADQGLAQIRAWARTAAWLAAPGARIMFEIGASQGPAAVAEFTNTQQFTKIKIERDLADLDRFVVAERAEKTGAERAKETGAEKVESHG